jgi:hypothetical protein
MRLAHLDAHLKIPSHQKSDLYQAKRHGCTISLEKQHKLERSLGYQSNT